MRSVIVSADILPRQPQRLRTTLMNAALTSWIILFAAIISSLCAAAQQRGKSGLQLPRFVSLKSDPVNLRTGPGLKYPKAWVFRRAGLPVEIIQEHDQWRRIRDSEGASGWILRALLSARRTALVKPWDAKSPKTAGLIDLRSRPSSSSGAIARVEPGTLANVRSCDGTSCYVSIGRFRGYLDQSALWGVYPDEKIE